MTAQEFVNANYLMPMNEIFIAGNNAGFTVLEIRNAIRVFCGARPIAL